MSAVMKKQKAVPFEDTPRPWRNHYAGMHIGSCKTIEGALITAYSHLVRGEANAATIVGPDDKEKARQMWTSAGISTWLAPDYKHRPDHYENPPKPLPRVIVPTKAQLKAQANRLLRNAKPAAKKNHLRRVK